MGVYEDLLLELDQMFNQMVDQQRKKILKRARQINPALTEDDVMQPHDFPELQNDSIFHFEDGLLAGLISAQIATRAQLREKFNG